MKWVNEDTDMKWLRAVRLTGVSGEDNAGNKETNDYLVIVIHSVLLLTTSHISYEYLNMTGDSGTGIFYIITLPVKKKTLFEALNSFTTDCVFMMISQY